ncbi:MAG: ImmA/IrrE family metallo-endopeptidase [Clostridiales bacterium]|nr:ImmA/IrrE family metallo-endopeptidase [Clostridiales bacterium]
MAEENKTESKLSYQEIEARRKERIAEITGQIEEGCRGILNSDSFRTYMQTMAKFHRYSYRNSLLIFLQKPDSTMIASYSDWKKKFGRQVNKGEKGIRIIAPAPYKTTREVDRMDPSTGKALMGSDGKPLKETKEITIPRFKAVSVFDYSQTSGRPLPTLGIKELQASVENYDLFLKAIRNIAPVPIRFADIEGGAKGYYDRANKEIVIQGGMPELQTLKTCCHELVHSVLHDDRSKMLTPDGNPKDKGIIETEAEGCALVCLTHFGFEDVGDYSFPYLVSYASSPDLKELHASLETIQETSSMIINDLEAEMLQLTVERSEQNKSYAEPGKEKPDMVADKAPVQVVSSPTVGRRESLLQDLRDKRDMVNRESGIGKGGKAIEPKKEEQAI